MTRVVDWEKNTIKVSYRLEVKVLTQIEIDAPKFCPKLLLKK